MKKLSRVKLKMINGGSCPGGCPAGILMGHRVQELPIPVLPINCYHSVVRMRRF